MCVCLYINKYYIVRTRVCMSRTRGHAFEGASKLALIPFYVDRSLLPEGGICSIAPSNVSPHNYLLDYLSI